MKKIVYSVIFAFVFIALQTAASACPHKIDKSGKDRQVAGYKGSNGTFVPAHSN